MTMKIGIYDLEGNYVTYDGDVAFDEDSNEEVNLDYLEVMGTFIETFDEFYEDKDPDLSGVSEITEFYRTDVAKEYNLKIMECIAENLELEKGIYKVDDLEFLYLAGNYALETNTDGVFALPVKALRVLGKFVQSLEDWRLSK